MKFGLTLLCALWFASPVLAEDILPGKQAFASVKQCVMENDVQLCHRTLTPESYPLFDRFVSYKLMPCLPTDFTYVSEEKSSGRITVKATMPVGGNMVNILRLVFTPATDGSMKLDIPASLQRGLGEKWENKIQLSESLYLMMRQNMGDKLTCDTLTGLVKR